MTVFLSIVALLAGLGAFLFGFKVLSDNIEKLASNKLRSWFDKTGKSRLAGVGIGTAVTAIIQSSSATTVMVVGFVNVGLMSLFQATAVIMGANIGTTITAHIASMVSIPFIEIITALTVVGVFMDMLCKNEKVKIIGLMLAGLGLVFLGLEYMSLSMADFAKMPAVENFLKSVDNRFVLLLAGIVITGIVQSSSAVTSLVISMAATGLVIGDPSNSGVLFLILGSNIGTCVTAILSSIGANTNAKRASLIHLMFNTFGAIIFSIFLLCWPKFMDVVLVGLFPGAPATQIAVFHTLFNVTCTILFLPFAEVFVKIATKLIRDPKSKKPVTDTLLLDERFLNTPSVAINQANKAAVHMTELAMESMDVAFKGFVDVDENANEKVTEINTRVADMEKKIVEYLIKISASGELTFAEEKIISAIHHATGDIIRISELSDNITKYTRNCKRDCLEFSQGVIVSLSEMLEKIKALYAKTMDVFDKKDITALKEVDAIEDEIDGMRKSIVKGHICRLNEGKCNPASSGVFINLVGNLERAADHLTYVAHSFDDSPSA